MPSFKDMTLEQKREYKRAAYEKNKESYNLAKIAKGLMSKSRKVRGDTIEKYNLQQNKDGDFVIPKKYKFKINYEDVKAEPPPPVINVVVAPENPSIENYDFENNQFNGKQLKDWCATVLSKMPKQMGSDNVRGEREIKEYMKVPDTLFEINKEKYNGDKDLTPWIRNTTQLIQGIDSKASWISNGTKAKFLGRILFLTKNFPPLKHRINKDIYTILDTQYNKWEGLSKALQRKKTKETPIFSWDVIKKQVFAKYGKVSYESLVIALYDEMIGRDDFQLKMAYKPDEMIDKRKTNYLLLERSKNLAAVYMNTFKTVGRYGKMVYKLSPEVTSVICKLHPNDSQKVLFPMEEDKLSQFIVHFLREIPLFKDEPGLGVKYLRHSLISTKLMHIDPKANNYDEQVFDLAEKAMHSVKMQETYTSPLKNEKGKVINNKFVESSELFDEWMRNIDGIPDEDLKPLMDHSLIGVKIQKAFKETPKSRKLKLFNGEVVGVEDGYYKVVYEDGDTEDMTKHEVREFRKKN
jgi:hypothetical protein